MPERGGELPSQILQSKLGGKERKEEKKERKRREERRKEEKERINRNKFSFSSFKAERNTV